MFATFPNSRNQFWDIQLNIKKIGKLSEKDL